MFFLLKRNGEFLPLFSSFVQYGDHNGNSKLIFVFLCIISSDPQNNFVRKVEKQHFPILFTCLFTYFLVEAPLVLKFHPFKSPSLLAFSSSHGQSSQCIALYNSHGCYHTSWLFWFHINGIVTLLNLLITYFTQHYVFRTTHIALILICYFDLLRRTSWWAFYLCECIL